jgi:D-beta-D-heptose 7-phosphate kinase / D-beta-D-heptose 1-phosphate adenosyltransferase
MNVPVLVDPARGRQWSDYGPVSLIKANWAEASEACGIAKCSPRDLALTLSERHDCSVVITRGKRGLVCAERKGDTWTLPAPCVTARDVCGAGDTILATIGVAIARGDSLHRACTQAVAAAAEQVTKIGVSIIDCKTRHAHTSPAGQLDDNYCDLTVSVHDDNAIAKSRTRDLQVAGP